MTAPAVLKPELIEIEPRPCELCGLTIDQQVRVDTPEGIEFFCEDIEREILQDAAELVLRWESADPRYAWRHTGERPPPEIVRNSDISRKPANTPQPYRTPQATVDAFWHVVGNESGDYLARWLKQHPLDAPHLHELWLQKCSLAKK